MPMPSKQEYLYQEMLVRLNRDYRPGMKLPTETVLCRELGVARETLRRTLGRLEDERRIHRSKAGTRVHSQESLVADAADEPVTLLMPSPDYLLRCDYSSLFINRHLFRGAMEVAIRRGRRVVTIPASVSNDPDSIDATQFSHLTSQSLIMGGSAPWYRNVIPYFIRANCRFALLGCTPECESLLKNSTTGLFYDRDYVRDFFFDGTAYLRSLGATRVLYFGSSVSELSLWGRTFFEKALAEHGVTGSFVSYSETLSLVKRIARLRETLQKEKYDGLILEINPIPAGEHSSDFYAESGITESFPVIFSVSSLLQQAKVHTSGHIGWPPFYEIGMEMANWLLSRESRREKRCFKYRFDSVDQFLKLYPRAGEHL